MEFTQHSRSRRLSTEEIEERRLNAIIVAATLFFVTLLAIGALAWVSSYDPAPGGSDYENVGLAD